MFLFLLGPLIRLLTLLNVLFDHPTAGPEAPQCELLLSLHLSNILVNETWPTNGAEQVALYSNLRASIMLMFTSSLTEYFHQVETSNFRHVCALVKRV